MEKRCILGGLGCIWRLGVENELASTAMADNNNDGHTRRRHASAQSDESCEDRSYNFRPTCSNHNNNGVPLMDISNEECISSASSARLTKLPCDANEGKGNSSFGDCRHGRHVSVGGSGQNLQYCDSNRGGDARQKNSSDEATESTSKDGASMATSSINDDSIVSSTGRGATHHVAQNGMAKCSDGVVLTSPLIPRRKSNAGNIHLVDHGRGVPQTKGSVLPHYSKTCVLPTLNQPNDSCCVQLQVPLVAILPPRKRGECVDKFLGQATIVDESCVGDGTYWGTEYIEEMINHFRKVESATSVCSIYMEQQQVINEHMRSILVDWLIDIHASFRLVPETLHLTINLVDRYLECRQVVKTKLQLVGVSCLLIASKYEECMPLTPSDLEYICDNTYQTIEIASMELDILEALDFRVAVPSAFLFLKLYLWAGHADRTMVNLSSYILDGTLMWYNLLHFSPSQVAAGAILVSRVSTERNPWSPKLAKYTSYQEQQVIPVARAILTAARSSSPSLTAVVKKYSTDRFDNVASLFLFAKDLKPSLHSMKK